MAPARPSWREEYAGRWPLELGALALLLAAASVIAPVADPDLPMHLALGEWIVRRGAVPHAEPFAWTRAGGPFFAYSWLPEVAFYSAYRAAGVFGLRVLQGLAVLGTMGAMMALARLARWSVWTAILLAAIQALLAMTLAPYLRPQVVLLMTVPLAWGFALRMLAAERPYPWALGTFALAALAANSHLLFALTAAPWLLLALRWPGVRRAAVLVGSTVAGWLLTPHTLHWPAIFAINFSDNALFSYPTPISELIPGVQAAVAGRGGLLVVALLLTGLPWITPRLRPRERLVWGAVWLAGLFAFALAARAMLLWWLAVLPLVAATVEPVARVLRPRAIIVAQRATLAALVLLLAAARARVSGAEWTRETGAERWLPARAAMWIDPLATWLECRIRPGMAGRAYTAFPFGTYLTWRYPAISYSIDSRNIFPDSVALAESYVLASLRPRTFGPWRSADLAIVPFRYPVAAVLDTAGGWRRAVVVAGEAAEADSSGVWVRAAWWESASDSALAAAPTRLGPGRSGVEAACR